MTRDELQFESENVQILYNELVEYAKSIGDEDISERVEGEVTTEDVAEIKVDLFSIEYINRELWDRVEGDLENLVGRIMTGRSPERGTADTRGEIKIYEFGQKYLVHNDFYDNAYTMIVPEDILRQECAEGWEAQPHGGFVESAHKVGRDSIELTTVEDQIVVDCLMTFLKLLDVDVGEVIDRNEIEVRDEELCAHIL